MRDERRAVLDQLSKEIWEHGQEKGWHSDETFRAVIESAIEAANKPGVVLPMVIQDALLAAEKRTRLANGINVGEQLMLIVTEAAEAMEAYRQKDLDPQKTYYAAQDGAGMCEWDAGCDETMKPEGVGSELADVIIRVFHLASRVGIDLPEEIERKMAYNKTREHRHGGKRC